MNYWRHFLKNYKVFKKCIKEKDYYYAFFHLMHGLLYFEWTSHHYMSGMLNILKIRKRRVKDDRTRKK